MTSISVSNRGKGLFIDKNETATLLSLDIKCPIA